MTIIIVASSLRSSYAPHTIVTVRHCAPRWSLSVLLSFLWLTLFNKTTGTGVVTSVPSDAPDDFVSLQMLKNKPDYSIKFGITPEMVDPFDVVPIIKVPLKDEKTGEDVWHEAAAVYMCEKLKIKSPNEKDKLTKAKDETYLRGFNFGVMTVGKYAGMKVSEAKPLLKKEMIEAGTACIYHEPEGKVTSRTGDECVVAATDQWYLNYGEEEWRKSVEDHVHSDNFTAYDKSSLQRYEHTLGWLHEWACTRQFGLGTQLPWDEQWVIESLSDSTIYMAYYTIAHYLQGADNLKGDKNACPSKIDPADLTDDVFNFIFRDKEMPANCNIDAEILNKMKTEFKYVAERSISCVVHFERSYLVSKEHFTPFCHGIRQQPRSPLPSLHGTATYSAVSA